MDGRLAIQQLLREAGVADGAGLVPLWPQAARVLGVRSRARIYAMAARGLLPTVRLGRSARVPRAWLEEVLATGLEREGQAAGGE